MAKLVDVGSIASHFESLSDPRHPRNRKHLLADVAVIAVAALICGCDGPTAIHRWAKARQERLARHLPLANGVPSRDCLRRVLMVLKPDAFQRCFPNWIAQALPADEEGPAQRLVNIDGKSCRGSHDAGKGLGALHIVRAGASEEGIALGQVATDDKSNAITAIPQLLDQLDVADTIVTIDAMGCQKDIAERIVDADGDFVIAVKDNQPKLHAAIAAFFHEQLENDFEDLQYRGCETREEGHGRIDERAHDHAKVPRAFAVGADWPEVKAIGYAIRVSQHPDGRESNEVRYDISSRYLSGKRFAEAVRGHGGPRVDALGLGRDVPGGRPPHAGTDAGQQFELAAPVRGDALEASSGEG